MKTALIAILMAFNGWACAGQVAEGAACRVRAVAGHTSSHGSGVAIGKREILTAAHVVSGSGVIKVNFTGDVWTSCRVVKIDREQDLALLVPAEDVAAFVELASAESSKLYMLASGESKPVEVSSGMIMTARANFGNMQHGCSGGAVIDASGKLVGIVLAGEALRRGTMEMRPDVTQFIGAGEIRAFLAQVKR